jgi:hypothetical protein
VVRSARAIGVAVEREHDDVDRPAADAEGRIVCVRDAVGVIQEIACVLEPCLAEIGINENCHPP